VFPVRIVPSSSGSPPLEVLAPELLLPTRKLAEQLARSLRVPLHDSSSGALVVRSADLLGAPLRDRLRREPPTAQRHSDVAPGRLSVRRAGADTVCKLPPAGVQVRQATMAAALVVGTGVTALTDTVGNRSLASFLIVMLGVAVWFPLSVWLLRAAFARDVVRFGRDGIHLRRWGLPWSTHIPAGELEELIVVEHERRPTLSEPKGYLVAGAHLTARSDKRTLDIGDHLSSAEVQWLHASICDAIAEPTPG
jgi:hypothetical protein